MPTADRTDFALQAVHYFQRQDRFERELIIVDDGSDDLAARLPDDPRIVYMRAPRGVSIGTKRNLACARARGAFIAQWDDDDWHGEHRLGVQVAALLDGTADITGLSATVFFDVREWRCWRADPEKHRTMFANDVHGGTLTFRREVWEQLAHYPDLSLQEDALFQREALEGGARLERVTCDPPVFMYVRHGRNTWPARSIGGERFVDIGEPVLSEEDRRFYLSRRLQLRS